MLRGVLIVFLILGFCQIGFGQDTPVLPCPTISVEGPGGVPGPDDLIRFTLSIGKEAETFKPTYKWTVSYGEIIRGQGTLEIIVKWKPDGRSLTASVDVEGLPLGCANRASDTMSYCILPTARKLDEFSEPYSDKITERLEKLVEALENEPSSRVLTFVYRKKQSIGPMSKAQRELVGMLVKKLGNRQSIQYVTADTVDNLIVVWLVPVGAPNPPY